MADLYRLEQDGGGRFTAYERDDGRWDVDRPGKREKFKLSSDGKTFSILEKDDGIVVKDIYKDKTEMVFSSSSKLRFWAVSLAPRKSSTRLIG